jgi:type II secretory ATPase GspE/PulE/Tfp pilus assembly ATPase PilB-like protein
MVLLLVPDLVLAQGGPVPRGPGFYFSPFKLLTVVAFYLLWARLSWWVDDDAEDLHMPVQKWNCGVFAAGAFGLFLFWVVPSFLLSFLMLLLLTIGPTLGYVYVRNQKVEDDERVLTPQHLRKLAWKYFKVRVREPEAEEQQKAIPMRFYSKSSTAGASTSANRAQGSPGYRAALEMVYEALEMRCTDIHMEPTKEEMTVRYRVDGIMQQASPFTRQMGDAVINIFKVLANLDITEKRKPQDGSFSGELTNRRKSDPDDTSNLIDFRVATAGSLAGEKLVMRLLDRSRRIAGLSQLGMREKMKQQVQDLVVQPHGMFIVCGPTGAGKSTTLYACLGEIDCFQRNVISIENPVEYQMTNVTQIEVNPKAGKTFASELRSILRQDPDVIYVGEIRDQETAEIACQAAQTGHMVLTTLHANDTVTAIGRLLDLGVQPFMIANAVSAVLGQRLVRVLCPKCKQKYKPNADLVRKANLPADKIKYFYRPPENGSEQEGAGCEYCGGTGYRGRTGVYELLVLNDPMRDMIRDNPNLNAIRQEAVKSGMKYLQEDGLRIVMEGDTSIQEVLRVCK